VVKRGGLAGGFSWSKNTPRSKDILWKTMKPPL
jgi:hypothetical protein